MDEAQTQAQAVRRDSAVVTAGHAAKLLRTQSLEAYINEGADEDGPSLQDRLNTARHFFPGQTFPTVLSSDCGRSINEDDTTSLDAISLGMAVSSTSGGRSFGGSSYQTSSSIAPSLVRSSVAPRSAPSYSSAGTSRFLQSPYSDQKHFLPDPDEEPEAVSRPCALRFLNDCPFRSVDSEQWFTHLSAHFRGSPPSALQCPLEHCSLRYTGRPGTDRALQDLRDHIDNEHGPEDGVGDRWARDSVLHEHLRCTGVIDAPAAQHLAATQGCSTAGVHTSSYNPRRENRERTRGGPRRSNRQ